MLRSCEEGQRLPRDRHVTTDLTILYSLGKLRTCSGSPANPILRAALPALPRKFSGNGLWLMFLFLICNLLFGVLLPSLACKVPSYTCSDHMAHQSWPPGLSEFAAKVGGGEDTGGLCMACLHREQTRSLCLPSGSSYLRLPNLPYCHALLNICFSCSWATKDQY